MTLNPEEYTVAGLRDIMERVGPTLSKSELNEMIEREAKTKNRPMARHVIQQQKMENIREENEEEDSCDYCSLGCPHESTAEGAIDWYQHYMAIPADELAADYTLKKRSDEWEVGAALERAVDARKQEIKDVILDGES